MNYKISNSQIEKIWFKRRKNYFNENKIEIIIIDNKNKSLYKGNINNDENKIEGFEI